jgi:hypothetical protein
MKRVTKVVCRFLASEYDEDGNMIYELPVAAGKEEFHACIFYPFGFNLEAYVAKINEELNAKERASELQGRVQGLPRETEPDQAAGDEEPGAKQGRKGKRAAS